MSLEERKIECTLPHIVNLSGGIGNQLFQFSFGQYIKARASRCSLFYDVRDISTANATHVGSDIRQLDLNIEKFTIKDHYLAYLQTFSRRQRTFFREKIMYSKRVILEEDFNVNSIRSGYYLGYWQDLCYLSESKHLLEDRVSKYFEHKLKFVDLAFDGLAVHVRRGDYLSSVNANIYHQYDAKEFVTIISKFNNLGKKIYIFSDDVVFVKNELDLDSKYVEYISDEGLSALDEFVLMSRFENIVVSNSTFSWWAAYLNSTSKNIIQLPFWFKNQTTPRRLVL